MPTQPDNELKKEPNQRPDWLKTEPVKKSGNQQVETPENPTRK